MQEISGASHILVPYDAEQLSLSAQGLRKRLEVCRKGSQPKRRFAFAKRSNDSRIENVPATVSSSPADRGMKFDRGGSYTEDEGMTGHAGIDTSRYDPSPTN